MDASSVITQVNDNSMINVAEDTSEIKTNQGGDKSSKSSNRSSNSSKNGPAGDSAAAASAVPVCPPDQEEPAAKPDAATAAANPSVDIAGERQKPSLLRELFCCFCFNRQGRQASSRRRQRPQQFHQYQHHQGHNGGQTISIDLLGPRDPQLGDRICAVIDLDETLVHSSFKFVDEPDFVIDVEIEGLVHQVYVLKRPHVDEFLERMGQLFECVLFTASLAKYADPVSDLLDRWSAFKYRLFRESCVFHGDNFVKDLAQLGREVDRCVIIDNSPASYMFNTENAIRVHTWVGEQSDTELRDLLPYMERLAGAASVSEFLRNNPPSTFQSQNLAASSGPPSDVVAAFSDDEDNGIIAHTGCVAADVGGHVAADVGGNVGGDVAADVGEDVAADVGEDVAADVGGYVAADVGGDVAADVAKSFEASVSDAVQLQDIQPTVESSSPSS